MITMDVQMEEILGRFSEDYAKLFLSYILKPMGVIEMGEGER